MKKIQEQERKQELLRSRAAALSAPPDNQERKAAFDVIVFRIGHEHYAIECGFMREVCAVNTLTMIPCTPRHGWPEQSIFGEELWRFLT